MRTRAWTLLALILGGFGLWGVWPVLAEGLGAGGFSAAKPVGLCTVAAQAALALVPGVCLALFACLFLESRAGRAGSVGSRLCLVALASCLAFALTLLLLLAGQPLRWWFVLAVPAGNGSLLSMGREGLFLFAPCYLPFTVPDLALGLVAGLGLALWTPMFRLRRRILTMAHGVVCILFFVRLWTLAQPGAAFGCLEQWAGLSLSSGAALGAVVVCWRILLNVERG